MWLIVWGCSELQSEVLPLLIPCPNKRAGLGLNQDKWILNPACDKLDLFRFLGKIIGIAVRNQIFLNLNLPPIVWKTLVDLPVTTADLEVPIASLRPLASGLFNVELTLLFERIRAVACRRWIRVR